MTTSTIIGETKGAPDNSQNALLHIYDQTLATGARAANGSGTGLGLVVWEEAIGVVNAGGFVSKFVTAATAARTLTIPDAAGTLVLGDGAGVTDAGAFNTALGSSTVTLASDFATTADTAQAVTGFTLPLAVNSTYRLVMFLIVETADSGRGLRPTITGPGSSVDRVTGLAETSQEKLQVTALATAVNFGSHVANDTAEFMKIEAVVTTNGTSPASELGLSIHSELSGTEVTLLAGSLMTLTKL